MQNISNKRLTGERALFQSRDLHISYSSFLEGESPLKESRNINIEQCVFDWKYPLWYGKDIVINQSLFGQGARAGIWYTHNIQLNDVTFEAPKSFRRSRQVKLENVQLLNADETFWNCQDIHLKNVVAKGDYFAMNSQNVKVEGLSLAGGYAFDGVKNLEISNSRLLSKDAFWNCEDVLVSDSFISGEYIGWNAKNLKFVNCTIESLQGLCYIENLIMENCTVINTDLAFEYSTVQAQIKGTLTSLKNPKSGRITVEEVQEVIFDNPEVNPEDTILIMGSDKHE